MSSASNLSIPVLAAAYREARLTPAAVFAQIRERIAATEMHNAWIHVLSAAELAPYFERLAASDPASLPLYGIPFAVKDNIDLAGVPTTAACPAYARVPAQSATVVARLVAAGAIPVGKTNLDQFATGLVGTRSPYGPGRNAFDPAYVSGGSSSGSALAVALGLASFALGTDTAGSGRVPAAFNNLVGVKPSCGLVSTRGVVPACRSLDCVSIFALDVADAEAVLGVAAAFDADDPYSRPAGTGQAVRERFRFGVPAALEYYGDGETAARFDASAAALIAAGGEGVTCDLAPFLDAARLLYEGPWVAERYAAIRDLVEHAPDVLFPVTRTIIEGARGRTAVEAFEAQYRLKALKRLADRALEGLDFVLTPTAPAIYTIAELEADPIALNSRLGHYTNFMNLLDYAAIAVPAGFGADALPRGVTLFGPAFADGALAAYAARLEAAFALPLGATGHPRVSAARKAHEASGRLSIAVCGAHLSGLPLNLQLTARGGTLVAATTTAPAYRFYALPGGPPARPGLVRVAEDGAAIEVEVWSLPIETIGSFLAGIPSPLGLGRVELADASYVTGFLCEHHALAGATDITSYGGWRAWLGRE
ncbi:MAG: allophanate hydrolase [Gammaproteobacteria bacterium]|nr:allophanate hydrolase [Gammaproteobacteria bacterium]